MGHASDLYLGFCTACLCAQQVMNHHIPGSHLTLEEEGDCVVLSSVDVFHRNKDIL